MPTTSKPLDLRCYVVTAAGNPRDIVSTAAAASRGGAGAVQVRSKPISARDLCSLAQAVAEAVQPTTAVLIDDRIDVALALRHRHVRIDGVHIGQDDLDPQDARSLLGPDALIGLTTGTLELVEGANTYADVIDYIGCGPFRATPTKASGRPLIGLEGYPALVAASELPMVAIGDVTSEDASALAATGVDGLAVVRGFAQAADPEEYARRMIAGFEEGRQP